MRNSLRIIIISLTFLLGSSLLYGSNEPMKVTVYKKDGEKKDFLFSVKPAITFLADKVVFGCPGEQDLKIDFKDIDGIAFTQGDIPVYIPSKQSVPGGTQVINISAGSQQQEPDPVPDNPDPQPEPINLSEATITLASTSFNYTGSAIEPELTVEYQGTALTRGTDYIVSYSPSNVLPGEVTMTISGLGGYTGSVTKTFNIVLVQTVTARINDQVVEPTLNHLSNDVVEAIFETSEGRIKVNNCYALPGTTITISVTPKEGYAISKADITPALDGEDPANLGSFRTYNYVIPASGNVTIEAMFSENLNLADAVLALTGEQTTYVYSGKAFKPAYKLTLKGQELVAGTDYSLSYKDNVSAGTATVTATSMGSYTGTVTATFTIDKAPLTIKAEGKSKVYGEAVPELTYLVTGFVNNEDAEVLNQQPVVATDATATSAVGEYAITVAGAEAENYEFIYEDAKLTVTKAMLTVTAEDKSKAYGEAVPELTITITGFVNDEDATVLTQQPVVATEATADSPVGEYAITVSGAEANNYDFTYEGAKLTVTKAMLTVTAEDKSKTYGEAVPEMTTTITGFVNDEDAAVLKKQPVAETEANVESTVGEYAITVSGAEADNYDFTYEGAKLTVTKAMLTATAAAQTKVYGDENPELTAMITGYVNGEDASAITTMPKVTTDCKAESAVGDYTIAVSGGEAQNYEFTYVTGTLTVTSRSLANATLKLTSDSVAYTGQPVLPEFTVQCGTATLIEGTDYTANAINNTEPGTATLTVTGKGNYDGQIETAFTIYLKPTVEVVINDMAVKPVLDENDEKHKAEFVTDYGKVIISDYYALPGTSVTLTIAPADDWLLGEKSILVSVPVEVQLSQQSSYVGTYDVPENGIVAISVLFLDREVVGINDYAGALHFEVIDGKTVRVLGARETAPVSVFDARGQQVAAEVVRSDRELIVRLANQPQGLYIIKVNNNTFKVYRK